MEVTNNPWKGHLKHPTKVTGKNLDVNKSVAIFFHQFLGPSGDRCLVGAWGDKVEEKRPTEVEVRKWMKTSGEHEGMYFHQETPRWWQLKYFLIFNPKIGEDEPILTHIFQMGWNHQLD